MQLQSGLQHAQQSSSQVVQSKFNDFLGQINALKVVVVQLEQKLREKSEEQARLRRSYERAVRDRGTQSEADHRAAEQQAATQTQTQVLQRKFKALLQVHSMTLPLQPSSPRRLLFCLLLTARSSLVGVSLGRGVLTTRSQHRPPVRPSARPPNKHPSAHPSAHAVGPPCAPRRPMPRSRNSTAGSASRTRSSCSG